MKIIYKNTYKDIFYFMHYTHLRNPVYLGFMGICSLFLGYSEFFKYDIFSFILTIIAAVVIFMLFHLVGLLLGFVSMFSKQNKAFVTEHTITLSDDSIKEETAFGNSELKWNGVQSLKVTGSYIFIYVSKNSAHVIPVKAFQSNEEVEHFVNYCKVRMAK